MQFHVPESSFDALIDLLIGQIASVEKSVSARIVIFHDIHLVQSIIGQTIGSQ